MSLVSVIFFTIGTILGFALRTALSWRRGKHSGRAPVDIVRSVTRFLFVTTQIFALVWVSASYAIAAYSTVCLGQPFPVTDLSGQAITTILGINALKVVENIFEHNNGKVFGSSDVAEDQFKNDL